MEKKPPNLVQPQSSSAYTQTGSITSQTNRRDTIAFAIFLAVVLLIWLGLTAMPSADVVQPVMLDNAAVFDLRSADFENTIQHINTRHEWDSWSEVFYFPIDFESGNISEPRTLNHSDYRYYQFFTHRITLLLIPDIAYGITMTSTDYSMRLFVDGREAALVGYPATTRAETVPRTGNVTYYFVPQNEQVDIIVHTANFWHQFGGEAPVFYIGTAQNIERQRHINLFLVFMIIGSLLTSALYHIALFVMNRKRKVELVFAVCCLLGLVMSSDPIPLFLPEYNWHIQFAIEYLVFYATFGMTALLFAMIMPQFAPKWLFRTYYAICAAFILTVFIFDSTIYTIFIQFFYPIGLGLILYGIVRLSYEVLRYKPNDKNSKTGTSSERTKYMLAFVGLLVITVFTVNDVLRYIKIPGFEGFDGFILTMGLVFTAPIGMVFFVFCYALLLALNYADTEREVLQANAENAALASEKRFKEDVLATVSHEVRTPLAVMSVYAQMAVKQMNKGNITEQTMTDLKTISNEAKRLAELASDALTMFGSKTDINKRTYVDIGAAVTQLAGLLTSAAKNENIEIKIEFADLPPVWGVSDELTRVLWNLFDNAIKHTKDGRITISGNIFDGFLTITIADNGEGMTEEALSRTFESGYSASGGTGLGLTFCKEIIKAHGGTISIESSIGNGCAVTFSLPTKEGDTANE